MRYLAYEYEMKLQFSLPISEHSFQLRALLKDNPYQKIIKQEYEVSPCDGFNLYEDGFSNLVIAGKAKKEHDCFWVKVNGIASVDYQNKHFEDVHPLYVFETKLTTYDEKMAVLWSNEGSFFEKMMTLTNNIYYELYYTPASTTIHTTAKEAFELKKGVCQDFSHIMLAVLRHQGYLARYVAGMMGGEGATHAWVEVYHEGKWYGFDPTNNRVVNNQYLVISKGRDYKDCAMEKGIFEARDFSFQKQEVYVKVSIIEEMEAMKK